MPIYKMSVECTTIGHFFLEAESIEAAIAAAPDVSSEAYKEEVLDTTYDVVAEATPDELTGRIINKPGEGDGWYQYQR